MLDLGGILGKGGDGGETKPMEVSSGECSWASTPESEEIDASVKKSLLQVDIPKAIPPAQLHPQLHQYEDPLLTLNVADFMQTNKSSRLTDKEIESKLFKIEKKTRETLELKNSGRPLGKYPQKNKKFILQTVCYDFQNKGGCRRGDKCNYSHVAAKDTVCLDWRETGKCERGDECRYAHHLGEGIYDFANSSFAVRQRQTQIQEQLNTVLATDKPDIPDIKMMKLMVPPDTKDQEIALEKGISVVLNKLMRKRKEEAEKNAQEQFVKKLVKPEKVERRGPPVPPKHLRQAWNKNDNKGSRPNKFRHPQGIPAQRRPMGRGQKRPRNNERPSGRPPKRRYDRHANRR